MGDLTIRDYEASDKDAVKSLNAGAWVDADAPEARGGMDAADLHAIDSVYLTDGAFLVAVDDGSVVGMVGLQRLKGGSFELRRMRVALAQQGRGIGRKLAIETEARARSLGAKRIVLSTTTQQTAARHVYEAMGYCEMGKSVLEDRHGRFDVVHYEKRL